MAVEPVTRQPPAGHVPRAVMTQRWTRLASLHWPADPADVAPLLPAGCTPDTFDGAAWVGLLPFAMREVRLLGTPPLPWLSSFLETNVRTYAVGPDGRRSVVFWTLEADRLLPVLVARAAYRLPYTWARMGLQEWQDDDGRTVVRYASRRRWPKPDATRPPARSLLTLRLGDRVGEPGELDVFLSARWALHSTWHGGATVRADVDHGQWPLRRAEVLQLDASLVGAVGGLVDTARPAHVLWSAGVDVRVGLPRPAG